MKEQTLNSASQIKTAVDSGKAVRCDGGGYEVIKDSIGQYLIHHIGSDYYVGLHGIDETRLNGKDFYIQERTP